MARWLALTAVATLLACEGGTRPVGEFPGPIDPEPSGPPAVDPAEPLPRPVPEEPRIGFPRGEKPPGGLPGRPPGATRLLPDPGAPFEFPPLQTHVPHHELVVSTEAMAALEANPRDDVEYPALFRSDGGPWQDVEVRYRGNSSRGWPKKSWRIAFPDDRPFDGRRKHNLLSEWRDQTQMIEKLGFDLYAAMGVPASRARFVRLSVNGVEQGVYLDAERIDRDFSLARPFADRDTNIYRCGRKDCEMKLWQAEFQTEWEKKTNELTPGQGDLDAFLRAIHTAPESRLPEVFDGILELEAYIRMMVADVLFSNDTVEDSRSYLVHDAVTGRWFYAPWDLNNTNIKVVVGDDPGDEAEAHQPLFVYTVTNEFSELEYQKRKGTGGHDWYALFSDLSTRIQFHPETRTRLLDRLDQALATLFTPEIMNARIDAMHALIAPYTRSDRHLDPALFADGPRYLKDYVARRRVFLQDALAKERAAQPGVVIEEVDPGARRIVLANLGDTPASLAGWVLTTNLRRRPGPNLPGGTVLAPGARLEVDASGLGLAPGVIGEVGLWSGPAVNDVVDLLYFGPVPAGQRWIRDPAEPERWMLTE